MKRCVVWTLIVLVTAACASANRPLQLLSGAGPIYPEAARAEGIEGNVTVRYDVDTEGVVRNAVVVASEPPGIFDEAALKAVRSWRFNAPLLDGQRMPANGRESKLSFRLGNSDYDNY